MSEGLIIAVGARTPLGFTALSSAAAVRAGVSRVREHPFMLDKAGEPFRVAMDGTIDEIDRVERMGVLAESALDEVLGELTISASTRLFVFLGLPEIGPTFPAERSRDLCSRLGKHLNGKCQAVVHPHTEGNAAGVVALQRALAQIAADPSALCIVGGVDSMVDPDLLESLDQASRVASSQNRWGFPPGEGACMLAVSSPAVASQQRKKRLASVACAVLTDEPNRLGTKTICLGVGLGDALREAASRGGGPITAHYCDIDGERYREHELSYAILRLPTGAFVDVIDYFAPADCWGHTGAATAPLLTLLPICFAQRGASPGPGRRPMIWCGSENGKRGAVVLHLEERMS
ncbi:MAG: hypothetical protein U0414_33230 [Polyangiaceae bacterium]